MAVRQLLFYRPSSLLLMFRFSIEKKNYRILAIAVRIEFSDLNLFLFAFFCTMLQVGAWYGLDQQQIIGLHRSLGLSSYFKAGCACYGRVLAGMIWRWNRQILLRLPMHLPLISLMSLKHLKKCFNNAF
ncbi:uncharacterized protein [Spinacia oleracea]|uniref:Uncharacterized protein isoform X2 n=1 Tax=Spinacia oleracea TaxID=3562 RepID=A0ABM3RVN6_SPIOL|nr:uncharacterized protein LOC130472508 isoform X2 [Spinacia oleracea]